MQSPVSVLPQNATVSSLIDSCSSMWKIDLIKQIFYTSEADKIWSILISQCGASDILIWGTSKDGFFTVKSAYHLEIERIRSSKGKSSTSPAHAAIWKVIWDLQIRGSITHFLWRYS